MCSKLTVFLPAVAFLCLSCDRLSFDQRPNTQAVPTALYGSYMLLGPDMDRFAFIGSGPDGATAVTYIQMQGEERPRSNYTYTFLAEKLVGRDVLLLYGSKAEQKKGIFTVAKYRQTDKGVSFEIHRALADVLERGDLKGAHVTKDGLRFIQVEGTVENFLDSPAVRWYLPFDMQRIDPQPGRGEREHP